jgi:pSer/pThr/pTyr-binding forkhead associated (FHA) protein
MAGLVDRISDRERRRAVASVPLLAAGSYLAVQDGDEHVVIPLEADVTRVGRSLVADVHLDDTTVSRRHALVVRRGDDVVVLDDRSRNGVFVNGERTAEAVLRDGDVIRLGRVTMRFVRVAADLQPA